MPSFPQPPSANAFPAFGAEAQRAAPLLFGTPAEVLERLVSGDPLALRGRVTKRLEAEASFLDGERLLARLAAVCALRAPGWRGTPALEAWLEGCLDEALALVLDEGRATGEGESGGRPVGPPWSVFAPPLALDPARLREACARFNRLPFPTREAFFRLVLDGAAPDALARSRGLSLTEVARRARTALETLRSALDSPSISPAIGPAPEEPPA